MGSDRLKRAAIAVIWENKKFLAIKRSQIVRAPGKICFPGGGIEDGESPQQAVVRELKEELGVAIEPGELFWTSTTAWDVEISWFASRLLSTQFTINVQEVAWYQWMTMNELIGSPDLLPSNADLLTAISRGQVRLPNS